MAPVFGDGAGNQGTGSGGVPFLQRSNQSVVIECCGFETFRPLNAEIEANRKITNSSSVICCVYCGSDFLHFLFSLIPFLFSPFI